MKSPAMVHQDLDLVQRLLRVSSRMTSRDCVDSEEEHSRTVEFINRMQPKLVNRVKFYTRSSRSRRVQRAGRDRQGAQAASLAESGGYSSSIRPRPWSRSMSTPANLSERGNARLEDTITKTNMEAVDEIARRFDFAILAGSSCST